jgi:hypothetical protein
MNQFVWCELVVLGAGLLERAMPITMCLTTYDVCVLWTLMISGIVQTYVGRRVQVQPIQKKTRNTGHETNASKLLFH